MNLRAFSLYFSLLITGACSSMTHAADLSGHGDVAISRLHELKTLNQRNQKESELRQNFFDRVIFQINTHYKNGSLHDFLATTYTQMAERQPDSPMYDFLMQAAQLLRQRQEKFENPIELTNRFIQAGGILEPLSAEQFLASQSYSNSERSESVQGIDREQLGDFIDKEIQPFESRPQLKTVEILE